MSRVLVVTETTRSTGEFRRPWVRRLNARYVVGYRRALAKTVAALGGDEVTVLTSRDFADAATLPDAANVRWYDELPYGANSEALAEETHALIADWWPERREEPGLLVRGVWLPDLLPVTKGILLRLEVIEALSAVTTVMDDVKPDRVVLVTGASIAERLAHGLATERRLTVVVARSFAPAFVMARVRRALHAREDRQHLRLLVSQRRRPLGDVRERPIVLTACHARHLEMVRPITLALARETIPTAVAAATVNTGDLPRRLERLATEGIPWSFLMDHVSRAEARRLRHEMRTVVRRVRRRYAARVSGAAAGAPSAVAAPFAEDAIRYGLPMARLYVEAAFRLLERERPRAVIVQSDRRLAERALALAAEPLGIPAMLFWGSSLLAGDRINRFDIGHRVLVIGEDVRASLVKQGVDAARIVVAGDPRSNAARLEDRARLREDFAKRFGLSAARPLVIMISKYVSLRAFSIDEKQAFYHTVHDAVARVPGVQVIVKVHPNEDVKLLAAQVRDWGWPDALLTQDADIHRLFAGADAAIMVTSMAGTEAMAMDCPVIAVQTKGKDFERGGYMPPYVTERAVERVDLGDAAGLARVLRTLLADARARADLIERGRAFAARYLHPVDGKLADRLLAVAEDIRAELAPRGPA